METIARRDEWEINIDNGSVNWKSDKGGSNRQHITYIDNNGKRLPMAKQTVAGTGFNINENNRATKNLDGRLWHRYNSKESDIQRIASRFNTSLKDIKEKQPLIKFEARTQVGPGIESKVKILGHGGHLKTGASKNVTNAVYTENGIDTYWGGDNILSSSGGLFLFSLGGNYNLSENELFSFSGIERILAFLCRWRHFCYFFCCRKK